MTLDVAGTAAGSMLGLGGEPSSQSLCAIFQDAPDIWCYEYGIHQRTARDGVGYVVEDLGAGVAPREAVFVSPQAVRAVYLIVDKVMRGFPSDDFALPEKGESRASENGGGSGRRPPSGPGLT
jgi:hypothetical protein